ncbi:MAG: iron ABC transporter permease [Paenibacillaceae bacterium]
MKRKLVLYIGAASLLLFFSILISLSLGSAHIPVTDVWWILLHKLPFMDHLMTVNWDEADEQIIMQVRLPRVILAIVVGASLAVAGTGFQGILRNPLADPYTLGVSSGASVGAAVMIQFGLVEVLGQWTVPLVAFVTGIVTLVFVFYLSRIGGKMSMETMILAGVVVDAFLGSFVQFMVSLSNDVVNPILYWLMGSISMKGWVYSEILSPYLLLGFVVMLSYGRALDLFALGERQASHLGVSVERTKIIVLVISTLLTAAAVSVSGVIGFVGLVVPHLVRLIVGPDYRIIIPIATIGGGIYVLWADTLARVLLSPREIQLGILTAFIGAPFFAYLLRKQMIKQKG